MSDSLDKGCAICQAAAIRNIEVGQHACIESGWTVVGYRKPQALQASMFESEPSHQYLGDEKREGEGAEARTMGMISAEPYLPTRTQPRS